MASLPSDGESSEEEAKSSPNEEMPDSAAKTAAQRGAQQGYREVVAMRMVGPGGKGSCKGKGKGSGKGLGKGQGKG